MTAWALSRSVPSIMEAESRYFVAILDSLSHSQLTSGFLGSSSTLTGVPSCGQVNALKASIASWFGASTQVSGWATSGPPSGAGMTGSSVGADPSLGAVVAPSEAASLGLSVGLSDGVG